MSNISIHFLFPIGPNLPTGGMKVIYDYCNRLAQDGCKVTILYAAYFNSTEKTLKRKMKAVAKYCYVKLLYGRSGYTWYKKEQTIKEKFVWSLNRRSIPEADVYIATAVNTASYLDRLNVDAEKKYYFVQGYENFIVPDDDYIKWTYRLPLKKIVISQWLAKLMKEEGQECVVIPDGFDFNKFKLTIPIEEKDKHLVSMLYHVTPNKDASMGLRAMEIARQQIPQLRMVMFGAYNKPADLPDWVTYYQKPSMELHLEINNQAAIYIGTSRKEGWGMTVGEAMMCGQAVACTDNDGFKEMAIDGVNALLSPVGDAETMAANIVKLVKDDDLRHRLAKKGLETIKEFDFEKSYQSFKMYILQEDR